MPVKLYGTPARGPRSMQAQPRRAAAAHSLRPRAGLSSVGLWGLNLSVGGHGRANACGCPCAHRRHHAGATRQPQPGQDGVMGSLAPEPWGAHGSGAEAWSPKPVCGISAYTAGSLVPCGDVWRSRHLLPGLETGGAATWLRTLGRDHRPWRVDGPATLRARLGDLLPGEESVSPAPALGDTHFRPGQRSQVGGQRPLSDQGC